MVSDDGKIIMMSHAMTSSAQETKTAAGMRLTAAVVLNIYLKDYAGFPVCYKLLIMWLPVI